MHQARQLEDVHLERAGEAGACKRPVRASPGNQVARVERMCTYSGRPWFARSFVISGSVTESNLFQPYHWNAGFESGGCVLSDGLAAALHRADEDVEVTSGGLCGEQGRPVLAEGLGLGLAELGEQRVAIHSGRVDADALVQLRLCERAAKGRGSSAASAAAARRGGRAGRQMLLRLVRGSRV